MNCWNWVWTVLSVRSPGIAKATQGDLTDKTIHTQFQQFIGTPAYMSPEQAELSGLDIARNPASDNSTSTSASVSCNFRPHKP